MELTHAYTAIIEDYIEDLKQRCENSTDWLGAGGDYGVATQI
jgi:hypothetical protein